MKLPPLPAFLTKLRIAPAWLIAGFLWIVMTVVAFLPAWQQLELQLLDKLMVSTAPNQSKYPITIIGIDAESFAKLAVQGKECQCSHTTQSTADIPQQVGVQII